MTVTPQTDLAGDAIADIRAAMGCLYSLHAGGQLDHGSMLAALNGVEANLAVLEAVTVPPPAQGTLQLPIMSLADVAARAQLRDTVKPRLTVVKGGAA